MSSGTLAQWVSMHRFGISPLKFEIIDVQIFCGDSNNYLLFGNDSIPFS
jgi:hypothetical protein